MNINTPDMSGGEVELCAICTPERDHNGVYCRSCANRLANEYSDRIAQLEGCDCVPCLVSSKSCRKCGRRAMITQEHFLQIVKQSGASDAAVS